MRGPLDAAHAAAEVGLETANFLEKVRGNSTLQNAGLLVLGVEKGTVKRDAWESEFGTVIVALGLGEHISETLEEVRSDSAQKIA